VSAEAHSHHEPQPLSTYFKVYGALLVLTVATVGVSEWMNLPSRTSILVAMMIAVCKASVVALWFMHLIADTRFNRFVFASSVFFLGLFFAFTLFDLGSRGDILQIMDNYTLRADRAGVPAVAPTPAPEGAH
jgi:cytochrome c oxidase subunit 4